MSVLKMNLRSGVAQLAQFTGIGKGVKAAAKPARVQPFVAIGGRVKPKAAKMVAAENQDDPPPADDDPDNDDEAMGDDDYGVDAPSDDDSPEEMEAKRARRVARRARRMKDTDPPADDPPPAKTDDPPPPPDEDAEDGDDSDAEMRGNSPTAAARRRERARCAAIFGAKAAATNIDLAAHLAFNTSMTRGQVIKALSTAPERGGGELADVMRGYAAQRPGAGPAINPKPQALRDRETLDAAFAAAAASRNPRRK